MHNLTLESGTVEINLAILGIDLCLCIMSIFKSPRGCVVNTFHSCFHLSDHWSVSLNAALVMASFMMG
jgi:hypothetical protein